MTQAQTIAMYQPVLQSIALKMVGSIADAEDIVHDTFLKWLTIDPKKIENTKAYLVKAVTNNSLNHLKKLKANIIDYSIDSIKHLDIIESIREMEIGKFDWENEVNEALAIIYKKLEPLERSIYVLKEFFNVEYEELQLIFDKKKENCRKVVSRAKAKLENESKKIKIPLPNLTAFISSFKMASSFGSVNELVNDLKKEISRKLH